MSRCPRPDKVCYPSRREASMVLRKLPRRKRRGTFPYRCRGCGTWHLGRRIRRPLVAWRAEP